MRTILVHINVELADDSEVTAENIEQTFEEILEREVLEGATVALVEEVT